METSGIAIFLTHSKEVSKFSGIESHPQKNENVFPTSMKLDGIVEYPWVIVFIGNKQYVSELSDQITTKNHIII